MSNANLPGDSASLLVPVHLDAWAVDSQNQQRLAWYYADFKKLGKFKSPLPEAFNTSDVSKPDVGIHLHWALPDALTHGTSGPDGGPIGFPFVPNRWLVARFNATKQNQWECKLWVVRSDYLGSTVGSTPSELLGNSINSIQLAEGCDVAISAGTDLEIVDADGISSGKITVSSDVRPGDKRISIQPHNFSAVSQGSSVRLEASSSFLHPFQPTTMNVAVNQRTQFNIQSVKIGKNYSVEAWEGLADRDGELFLRAVGPGNVSFAAYVPGVRDVFSFTDIDLPREGTGDHLYTYLVVGWYSDPAKADPLRGITSYLPDIWRNQSEWQNQTQAERLKTLLAFHKWSVKGDIGATIPSTSLYHGMVIDVEWPPPRPKPRPETQVAVANTSADALAALIRWEGKNQKNPQAGETLAALVQASMYDLLDVYGTPGGSALIRQRIHEAWFGSEPGGTIWEVVSAVPQSSGESVITSQLTPEQITDLNSQLADLNRKQRDLDEEQRQLESLQSSLYMLWLKVGIGNSFDILKPKTEPIAWKDLFPFVQNTIYPDLFKSTWDQYCTVAAAKSKMPNPNDSSAASAWANSNWTFTTEKGKTTLADLGLELKASAAPRYWHPNDPVLLISGAGRSHEHGEDGRYNKDGTLTCRLPGQTITGVNVSGQPEINVGNISARGINLTPFSRYTSVPAIPNLTREAFFVDPMNAAIMANSAGGKDSEIRHGIESLLGENGGSNKWMGTPPVPFAVAPWQQAWSPLFLEWELHYYPTREERFFLDDWAFDGENYGWKGTGLDLEKSLSFKGRTTLTPQVAFVFKDKIEEYLEDLPDADRKKIDDLISTISNWDILSQSLSGFTDQLVTLLSQETFPPTPSNDSVPCPPDAAKPPSATALIGDQYRHMPLLGSTSGYFHPVRGGLVHFGRLQIVDAFGQTLWLSEPNTTEGFEPLMGIDLPPSNPSSDPDNKLPFGSFQLTPRIIQSSELDIKILSNDDSGNDIFTSANPNPVCGWLLPNHLDGGISVYDGYGVLLGELLALPFPDNWRPRPGAPGTNPPPATPDDIPNAALRSAVVSIARQTPEIFKEFLKVIDETLWMVDPLGGRRDQYLSVLIGRPLAVVQVQMHLGLRGEPFYSQLWNDMAVADESKPSELAWNKRIGEVGSIAFPVRLGSLDLRNDGLIGYFLPGGNYSTFYSVHASSAITEGNKFVKPMMKGPNYQGDISLQFQHKGVTATLLMDPRGCFHAYTGILPVKSTALPANLIEDFIKRMNVTFQTGPIIADPGTLRIPRPAEEQGEWRWIQPVPPPANWEEDSIVNADDRARMPDAQMRLREGWLQLSGLDSLNKKSPL